MMISDRIRWILLSFKVRLHCLTDTETVMIFNKKDLMNYLGELKTVLKHQSHGTSNGYDTYSSVLSML